MKDLLHFAAACTAFAFLGQASAGTFAGKMTAQAVILNKAALLALKSGLDQGSWHLSLADPTICGPELLHQFRAHNCC